ncbi:MAG: hypothetical protein OXG56_01190 [Gammaproteobacteria bacterium]|nr:hypothetical protein [Gammaproteobacteria bacterium]
MFEKPNKTTFVVEKRCGENLSSPYPPRYSVVGKPAYFTDGDRVPVKSIGKPSVAGFDVGKIFMPSGQKIPINVPFFFKNRIGLTVLENTATAAWR